MNLNKENENENPRKSKIPVLIRSQPKSERLQPKVQQPRLLMTAARGPLRTIANQQPNQELAGPSHAQTKLPRVLKTAARGPLRTIASQQVNQDLAGPSHAQAKSKLKVKTRYVPQKKKASQIDQPKSERAQPKLQQPRILETAARRPLRTIASQQVNQDLAGPSHAQAKSKLKVKTRYVPQKKKASLIDQPKSERAQPKLQQPRILETAARRPLRTIASQQVKQDMAGPSHAQAKSKLKVKTRYVPQKKKAIQLNKNAIEKPASPIDQPKSERAQPKLQQPRILETAARSPLRTIASQQVNQDLAGPSHAQTHLEMLKAVTAAENNSTQCYTMDVLLHCMKVEKKPSETAEISIPDDLRSHAVNKMIHINGANGQPAVVQYAASYFDNLCSTTKSSEQLNLMSAACVWIAQKNCISSRRGMNIVNRSNHAFTMDDLLLAERHVLRELKFSTLPIIPEDYIPYLSLWCDPHPRVTEVAATFLCLCGLTVSKSIGLEYASVVAAASVKTALMLLKKEQQERMLEKCSVYNLAVAKADFGAVCAILRESLHKMVAVDSKYKGALIQYSKAPQCIAPILVAYANQCEFK